MLSEKYKVDYPNLSDNSRDVIRKYNVVDPIFGIAKISFFVINKDGIITWKSTNHSNVDPNDLPKFEVILEAVQKAK
jgi:alkyl hydroperoxide reductase subunit AhpC